MVHSTFYPLTKNPLQKEGREGKNGQEGDRDVGTLGVVGGSGGVVPGGSGAGSMASGDATSRGPSSCCGGASRTSTGGAGSRVAERDGVVSTVGGGNDARTGGGVPDRRPARGLHAGGVGTVRALQARGEGLRDHEVGPEIGTVALEALAHGIKDSLDERARIAPDTAV